MEPDLDILIIGAGMSGLGTAIQLRRQFPTYPIRFELIEKTNDVGGTWLVNTYPGCGCDVASHFYSYSFALNPDWSQKFSMRSEIQRYFRNVAERWSVVENVRFGSVVETARWRKVEQMWEVEVKDLVTGRVRVRTARALVSAVGSLSIPKPCEVPGAESFDGPLFHSAQWDHSFDWTGKHVVVLGNGCSATQFVPVMADKAKQITQFARSAHFLAERPNPVYGQSWKWFMRHFPLAMRVYRFWLYAQMEKDFAGFGIESGRSIREDLKRTNEEYVKKMAPEEYWDALIPKYDIGCKRKVMDTDYLSTLHRSNVDLVSSDPAVEITATGVKTKSGRTVHADAIVLATGFQVFRMLAPMQIYGRDGTSLNRFWDEHHQGAAQAYLGTCVPGFPNFFTLMGPNTVTGHLSVIYTVECQINFMLRLLRPVVESQHEKRSVSAAPSAKILAVDVKPQAHMDSSNKMQAKLRDLVWSSGTCTSWALDPKTGINIAMYPQYQFLFWLKSIFIPAVDFDYVDGEKQRRSISVGGYKAVQTLAKVAVVVLVMCVGTYVGLLKMGRW